MTEEQLRNVYAAEIQFDLQNFPAVQTLEPNFTAVQHQGQCPRRLVLELSYRRSCSTLVLSDSDCGVTEGRRVKHLTEQAAASCF
ncbi:dynein heavy chain 8, axonemal-like [Acipenser oxyrinchus oxyrinchus]|uniref:Dynein heavy chain 8, axonemal-like n=1 Tax=Acipenser oxyrinchus oxyrinchus TaxID=40147 RepID=A0AAD8LNX9_ACIOX|nr:dynein heavy chain 8, axonemal-like [Acipenser oxyrinchus oxyrinchus]